MLKRIVYAQQRKTYAKIHRQKTDRHSAMFRTREKKRYLKQFLFLLRFIAAPGCTSSFSFKQSLRVRDSLSTLFEKPRSLYLS